MNVEVIVSHYGQEVRKIFPTLREALMSIAGDVEFNVACPKSLTMPTTIIGAPPVTFTEFQIYAMLDLVREPDDS